ncbi:MAG: M1 family metallopeptidase [Chloroflexi bacterium]|nr:M1 family metallopeptidase [Chloroflexota bacterium]
MNDANFRLPGGIRPRHYAIHLALNLEAWTYRGQQEIELQLDEPASVFELHAVDLQVESATLSWSGGDLPLGTAVYPERQTVACSADRAIPAGAATLRLRFSGRLRDELRGLYRVQVGEQRYAFTQCEATEARRIFPCFDEPAFKARFSLSVQAPGDLAVVSNEPIAREAPGPEPGTRLVTFETTPRMSTYLFALAVGKLEASPAAATASGAPVRVWTVPGKAALGAFATEAAVASLERLEAYFGLPYPYRKLDLLAVPDFEAGAMENSGAVFFRERRLLCDRDTAPLETLKGIGLVIAHELAHQWFGNLVTMQWWDDLWLNESFATWMEHVVVDDWQPDWKVWRDFQREKAAPFYTDALVSTRPIRAAVANAEQASEMFDAITYEKGAAVLRMIEQYLSPPVFRAGVRRYLREHLEGNASATDLFDALAVVSAQPIRAVAADWIDQPGYPVLAARLVDGGGERRQVELRQRRFFLHPDLAAAPASSERWHVPVVLKYQVGAAVREQRLLLEGMQQQAELDAPGSVAWLAANAGEDGFFRVAYDQPLAERLVANLDRALGPAERVGFLGNQWALVRAGQLSAAAFLELLRAFKGETSQAVVEAVVDRLAFYRRFLVDPAGLPRLAGRVEELFRPAFQRLGWSPAPGEDDETRLRRAEVLRALGCVARAEDVVGEARRQLERHWAAPGSVDANLLDVLVAIAAQQGDEALFEAYLARSQGPVPPDEQYRHRIGLGAFEDPALVQRALALALAPAIQTQDVGFLLCRLLANEAATEAAWRFIQQCWDELVRRLPPLMVRRVIQATVNLGTAQARQEVEAFFTRHPVEATERTLRQALEELDLLVAFRARAAV